jgi:glycosyltransferase involved in cell wall biosynthesis
LLERLDRSAEVILVDDGSRDDSYELMLDLSRLDSRFKLQQLSRNFGHQVAITVGLDCVVGRAVIVMDADLQDPPETVLATGRRARRHARATVRERFQAVRRQSGARSGGWWTSPRSARWPAVQSGYRLSKTGGS